MFSDILRWYWGPLSWEEASIILKDKLDGSFLVRDSSDDRYILSLSIRCNGRTLHTRIQHYKGRSVVSGFFLPASVYAIDFSVLELALNLISVMSSNGLRQSHLPEALNSFVR